MEDRERQPDYVEQLRDRRRLAAERVRSILQELEAAEREFAEATDDLARALRESSRDAAA